MVPTSGGVVRTFVRYYISYFVNNAMMVKNCLLSVGSMPNIICKVFLAEYVYYVHALT